MVGTVLGGAIVGSILVNIVYLNMKPLESLCSLDDVMKRTSTSFVLDVSSVGGRRRLQNR